MAGTGTPAPDGRGDEARRGGRAEAADAWGIVGGYEDAFGVWTQVPRATRDALVVAMGGEAADPEPPQVDGPLVARTGARVDVPGVVEVVLEDGGGRPVEGGRLPADLPPGYHTVAHADGSTRSLIVSPGRCHPTPASPTWGWAAQLYAVRSRASWGVGDFADLAELARWSASEGAGTLLINPLDAVTPVRPREPSPYYPSSRRFLDPLYLRIEQVAGVEVVDDLEALATRGRALDERDLIDRDEVADLKLEVLWQVWHRSRAAGREPGFLALLEERGHELLRFATFCALAEEQGTGWRGWPQPFRHPDGEAVAAFTAEHADRVRFHAWLQWLCETQLAAAAGHLEVMGDLPIGADPDGFDAWDLQDVLAEGVTVGAPPDALAPGGQDWQLPALVPWKLRAADYEPFAATLRAAMRHVGALRIDHVLGLFRLFWVPPGGTPADGTYVRMPADDLLDVLALESHRAGAWVVGEDLGTVEEGVRDELAARDILRYQVWWFEQDPIERWSPDALASVSTHDLPTVAGVWTGADARHQRALGLEPDEDWHATLRARLAEVAEVADDAPADEVTAGVHAHLARAPNRVVVAQLDDALAVTDRINVPGTDREQRPANWSLPLPVHLDDLPDHPTVRRVVAALAAAR